MAYASYKFYTSKFYGSAIAEADFPGLSARASNMVDYYTGGKSRTARGDDLTAVKNAVCALAEVIQDENRLMEATFPADRSAQVKSETIGNWSRSYGSTAATGTDIALIETRKRDAVLLYLGNTGMLTADGYWGCSR